MARIILADDNSITRQFYTELVTTLGHEAFACPNGKVAVQTFAEKGADLVLLDYEMPVMNGFEACRQIRRNPSGLNVPVIIISAHTGEEEILEGINAGATDYLPKPVKEAHLTAKIKAFLNMSSLHREDLDLVRSKAVFAGRYQISRVLGYGAHSVVFQVSDLSENGSVKALKLFCQSFGGDSLSKLIIEKAEKIKSLECGTAIQIFDYGVLDGRIYMVMEFADGGDLGKFLKLRNLSELEAVSMTLDITEALRSLDEAGISHFDIKPENIFICGSDFKLGDFGVFEGKANSTMKLGAEMWGTSAYVAPEYLASSSGPDISGDIYSLGVTIYEAVLGENPFRSPKPVMSMFRQLNFVPPPLSDYNVNFSPIFSQMVQKMLQKNPADRPSVDTIQYHFGELIVLLKKLPPSKLVPVMKNKVIFEDNPTSGIVVPEISGPQGQDIGKVKWEEVKDEVEKLNRKRQSLRLRSRLYEKLRLISCLGTGPVAVVVIVLFLGSVSFGYLATMLFRAAGATVSEEDAGTYCMVTCRKCGLTSEKSVADISKCCCESCGGELAYAMECEECRELFPMGKDVPADIPEEQRKDLLLAQRQCQHCGSHFTRPVMTSREKMKLANMKSGAPPVVKDGPQDSPPEPEKPAEEATPE